jgi:hypothetical protein
MHGPGRSSGEFFVAFYDLLTATSDEATSKFRNTDMAEQVRTLQSSVTVLLNFFVSSRQDEYLGKLAERHSKRGVDIPPELYSVWLDCLIETVRQFDPKFWSPYNDLKMNSRSARSITPEKACTAKPGDAPPDDLTAISISTGRNVLVSSPVVSRRCSNCSGPWLAPNR